MPGSPPTTPNLGIPRFDDADTASFSAQVNSVADRVDAIAARKDSVYFLQTGDVLWTPGSSRAGCLPCTGGAFSRTTYAALYAVLGGAASPWGQGDGSTTFNVPDLRGCVPMGAGQRPGLSLRAVGAFLGEEKHLLTIGEFPLHGHGLSDPGHAHGVSDPTHGHGISDPTHGHGGSVASANAVVNPAYYAPIIGDGGMASFQVAGSGSSGAWVPRTLTIGWVSTQLSHGHVLTINASGTGISVNGAFTGITINNAGTGLVVQGAGGGASHNVVQPSVVGNFWIKT